jgi:Fur family peroxide stress response transcriptional regulator
LGWKKMASRGRVRGKLELRQRLAARGCHFTQQRAAVFDYLSSVSHHPTAEEIFLAVKRRLPKISLATVYKNLESLVACGAISRLTYGDGSARYDIRTDHHYHMRCLKCGKVSDLEPGEGSKLLKRIKPQAGFEVIDYRLELLGYCRKCR